MFEISNYDWFWLFMGAVLVGFSRSGLSGIGIFIVIIFASVFPAKASTGIILPLLVFADIFAIIIYKRHADWRNLIRVLIFTLGGIILGYFFMDRISDNDLKIIIGIIVLFILFMIYFLKFLQKKEIVPLLLKTSAAGLTAGFITMCANAAGPLMNLFFISQARTKYEFISTRVWFFFIVNLIKLPFSRRLGLITLESLKLDLYLAPAILAGLAFGYFFVKHISQKNYIYFIHTITLISAIRLIIV